MTWMAARASADIIADEVGFQSVRNLVDAIEDERKGARWMGYEGATIMPYSSLARQTASFMDPNMRKAQTFIDGFKNSIPFLRETLPAKRNPVSGEPMPNPGYHAVIRNVPAATDPVMTELDRLDIHPTAQRAMVGHTRLTPEQYEQMVATSGPLVHQTLNALFNSPDLAVKPIAQQQTEAKAVISVMRRKGAKAFMLHNPELIQQGIDKREKAIEP